MKTLYQLLLDRWNQNCDTVLVTIVEGNGSIPRTTGAYMRQIRQAEFMEQLAAEIWNIRP